MKPLIISKCKSNNLLFILACYTEQNISVIFISKFKSETSDIILFYYRTEPNVTVARIRKWNESSDNYFSTVESQMLLLFTSKRKSSHLTFILASSGSECYCYLLSKVKANIRHLFNHHTELNIIAIHFRTSKGSFDIYFSIFRSWMLLLFTFEHYKSKHQT